MRVVGVSNRTRQLLLAALVAARPFRVEIAGLAVVALLGALVAVVTVLAPVPPDVTQDRWSLPQWHPYAGGSAREEVLSGPAWGDTPASPKKQEPVVAKQVPPWRFVGTVAAGSQRLAVVEVNGTNLKRLAVGDELPNGARIEAVNTGELTYAEENAPHTVRLFDGQKPDDSKAKEK